MRKLSVLIFSCLLFLVGAASASRIVKLPSKFNGHMIYFGDSLTDMGNKVEQNPVACVIVNPPVTNPVGGQFPNRTWADMQQFGFSATPSKNGGNDYAISGATYIPSPLKSTPPVPSIILNEIPSYFADNAHRANGNKLYVFWGGADDILDTIEFVILNNSEDSQAELAKKIEAALTKLLPEDMKTISSIISIFYNKGARNFLFIGMPDLSKTPLAADENVNPQLLLGIFAPLQGALQEVSNVWNNGVSGEPQKPGLKQILQNAATNPYYRGIHIYYFDPTPLLDDIIAHPEKYGFNETNQAIWCDPNGTNPLNPDTFMFFNYIHPTTAVHALIAEQIRNNVMMFG